MERLAVFDFETEHRPGRNHGNGDGVSRIPNLNSSITQTYGGSEGPCPPTFNRALFSHPTFSSGRPNFFRGQSRPTFLQSHPTFLQSRSTFFTKSPHFFYKVAPLFLQSCPTFFTKSPHFFYKVAPLFLQSRSTFFTKSPHFFFKVALLSDFSRHFLRTDYIFQSFLSKSNNKQYGGKRIGNRPGKAIYIELIFIALRYICIKT